jgi:hypothetical protein
MKSIKNLLALAVFLIGGYAVAETQAISSEDSVVVSEQTSEETNVSDVPEQVSMQVDSDKVAELEALVQKVLDAQKPSNAKRVGVVALKEALKAVGLIICSQTIKSYPKLHVSIIAILFLLLDRYFYNKDVSLDALIELEKKISVLSKEQKEKFIASYSDKYALLLEKINKEENLKRDLCGNLALSIFDLTLFCFFTDWAQFYEPMKLMREFNRGFKNVIFGELHNKIHVDTSSTGGYVEYVRSNLFDRTYSGFRCLLFVAFVYQLGSNLYHDPSLEKTRALARIQKALS